MQQDKSMPATLRLKQDEQDLVRRKSIEINKVLIANDHQPVTESELLHIVIKTALKYVKADKEGKIFIDM